LKDDYEVQQNLNTHRASKDIHSKFAMSRITSISKCWQANRHDNHYTH